MINYDNDILTVEDMMEALYIGRNYAYKMLNSGEIKGFRVGMSWRIKIDRRICNKFVQKLEPT